MEMRPVIIEGRPIGKGHPCFLAAETGTTAIGDLERAKHLIDMARDAGFDAVKFQTIGPESNISDRTTTFSYRDVHGELKEENMFEMFENLTFSQEEWLEMAEYARKREIIFFSTVDYLEGVDIMEKCGVPLHKMSSWDVTYEPLIKRMAATNKPVMLDAGPASLSDIVRFVDLFRAHGTGEVIILHDFHTDVIPEMNMRAICYLQEVFGLPVGFSAPGRDADLDIMAIALGANAIEKRITVSRSDPGHHHAVSLEEGELKAWVDRVRRMEAALGTFEVRPPAADLADARKYFRSVCTIRDIRRGEAFGPENLDAKRPGTGLPSRYLEVFYMGKASRDIPKDTLLDWSDVGV